LEAEFEMTAEGPPLAERLRQALEQARARRDKGQPLAVKLPDLDSLLGQRLQAALQRVNALRAWAAGDPLEGAFTVQADTG
jgi:hypothetical protein